MTSIYTSAILVHKCVGGLTNSDVFFMSKYVESLSLNAKEHYLKKISLIGNIDPFTLGGKTIVPGVQAAATSLPVSATDLVSYLVLQTSFVTVKQFKAHKSLEAYNQFTSGWVKDVRC